jgi:predicted ATPase
MRQLVGVRAEERPEQTAVRLAEQCAVWFGDGRVEATYPYLAQFMGLPLDEAQAKRLAGLGGESVRWHIFALLPQILQAASQINPLVVALDDLQWADETSLELLEAVLPLAEEWPILFLLAMRPQPIPLVERLTTKVVTTNVLGHLGEGAARALLAHHAPHLPVGLVPQLVEKAGGNPLYLVELVRTLEARGLLAADDDKLTIEALDLPNSVQGLLLAQLDRLATEARLALQMASVIDKTFWDDVLGRMATAEMDMDAQIVALQAGEFIQAVGQTPLGQAHTFRHILIQESAYGTLLYERRRAYHRQVAEVLEELFPFQLTEQAALRGHHYEQAGEVGKALGYYSQAADRARLLYAHGEAQGLYERVLGLLAEHPDGEVEAKTYLEVGADSGQPA